MYIKDSLSVQIFLGGLRLSHLLFDDNVFLLFCEANTHHVQGVMDMVKDVSMVSSPNVNVNKYRSMYCLYFSVDRKHTIKESPLFPLFMI